MFLLQTCTLTFASWTFPTSKLDLRADRSIEVIRGDIDRYFVNSGEWDLVFIDTAKIVRFFVLVALHFDFEFTNVSFTNIECFGYCYFYIKYSALKNCLFV